MSRPLRCRRIAGRPGAGAFKPVGVPTCRLEWLNLALDEFEALRLADMAGLHQDQAAVRMGVSRQTFGRIVESARHKVARAFCSGRALSIAGGAVRTVPERNPRRGRTDRPGHPGAQRPRRARRRS